MTMRAAVMIVLLVAAGAWPARADLAEVKSAGTLRVIVNLDPRRPEFFAGASSPRPGFDHEVLSGFAALHRITVTPVYVNGWDALIPALLSGKGDVIAGRFTATEARRKQIAFTSEVFPYRLVVITRKPHRVVTTLGELRKEKIASTKGSAMIEVLEAVGVPASARDDSVPTGGYVEALKAGRATAAVWGVESAIASRREGSGPAARDVRRAAGQPRLRRAQGRRGAPRGVERIRGGHASHADVVAPGREVLRRRRAGDPAQGQIRRVGRVGYFPPPTSRCPCASHRKAMLGASAPSRSMRSTSAGANQASASISAAWGRKPSTGTSVRPA